jgi:hypothetical protein
MCITIKKMRFSLLNLILPIYCKNQLNSLRYDENSSMQLRGS